MKLMLYAFQIYSAAGQTVGAPCDNQDTGYCAIGGSFKCYSIFTDSDDTFNVWQVVEEASAPIGSLCLKDKTQGNGMLSACDVTDTDKKPCRADAMCKGGKCKAASKGAVTDSCEVPMGWAAGACDTGFECVIATTDGDKIHYGVYDLSVVDGPPTAICMDKANDSDKKCDAGNNYCATPGLTECDTTQASGTCIAHADQPAGTDCEGQSAEFCGTSGTLKCYSEFKNVAATKMYWSLEGASAPAGSKCFPVTSIVNGSPCKGVTDAICQADVDYCNLTGGNCEAIDVSVGADCEWPASVFDASGCAAGVCALPVMDGGLIEYTILDADIDGIEGYLCMGPAVPPAFPCDETQYMCDKEATPMCDTSQTPNTCVAARPDAGAACDATASGATDDFCGTGMKCYASVTDADSRVIWALSPSSAAPEGAICLPETLQGDGDDCDTADILANGPCDSGFYCDDSTKVCNALTMGEGDSCEVPMSFACDGEMSCVTVVQSDATHVTYTVTDLSTSDGPTGAICMTAKAPENGCDATTTFCPTQAFGICDTDTGECGEAPIATGTTCTTNDDCGGSGADWECVQGIALAGADGFSYSAEAGTCSKKYEAGATCDGTDVHCATGDWCRTADGICYEIPVVDGPCGAGDEYEFCGGDMANYELQCMDIVDAGGAGNVYSRVVTGVAGEGAKCKPKVLLEATDTGCKSTPSACNPANSYCHLATDTCTAYVKISAGDSCQIFGGLSAEAVCDSTDCVSPLDVGNNTAHYTSYDLLKDSGAEDCPDCICMTDVTNSGVCDLTTNYCKDTLFCSSMDTTGTCSAPAPVDKDTDCKAFPGLCGVDGTWECVAAVPGSASAAPGLDNFMYDIILDASAADPSRGYTCSQPVSGRKNCDDSEYHCPVNDDGSESYCQAGDCVAKPKSGEDCGDAAGADTCGGADWASALRCYTTWTNDTGDIFFSVTSGDTPTGAQCWDRDTSSSADSCSPAAIAMTGKVCSAMDYCANDTELCTLFASPSIGESCALPAGLGCAPGFKCVVPEIDAANPADTNYTIINKVTYEGPADGICMGAAEGDLECNRTENYCARSSLPHCDATLDPDQPTCTNGLPQKPSENPNACVDAPCPLSAGTCAIPDQDGDNITYTFFPDGSSNGEAGAKCMWFDTEHRRCNDEYFLCTADHACLMTSLNQAGDGICQSDADLDEAAATEAARSAIAVSVLALLIATFF